MPSETVRNRVEELLALADVELNGDRPWDMQVHNERLYARAMAQGALGLGEAYMDGWWDCERLDEFFFRIVRARLDTKVKPWRDALRILRAKLINLQKPTLAFRIGRRHYDIDNELFRCMLDERMIYSCAYWRDAVTLGDAQEAKLDMVCRKLGLRPGMRVLDVGCGWGGAAKFAAERYNVTVLGITVSAEQVKYAQELCDGLDVEIRLQDYRDLDGEFDRVLSLGMVEHVGYRNHEPFMRIVRDHLVDDGLFLLHTIGNVRSETKIDPWTDRYIFPDSLVPSAKQICTAIEGKFVIEDWHSFGVDYDKTLMHWYRNFEQHWPGLKRRYDERFYRMWTYYLLFCAGSFRARHNQLWQVVLSPHGVLGGYLAPR
jgi:cyclopropane-fatty-acyl-phospholipid synthase